MSDDSGAVALSDREQEELRTTYDKWPNNLWVVFNNHARNIAVHVEDDWGKSSQSEYALDAMGYSDLPGIVSEGRITSQVESLVTTENKTKMGASLLKKVMEGK